MLLFWTSHKDVVRVREKARGDISCLSQIPSEKKRNKTGISGCSLFVVACFQPATSIDHFILYVFSYLCLKLHATKNHRLYWSKWRRRNKRKKAQGICLLFFLVDVWSSYVLPFFFHRDTDSVDTSITEELTVQWLTLPSCVLHSV